MKGNYEIVRYLIEKGAKLSNTLDCDTILEKAIQNKELNLLKYMAENEINLQTNSNDLILLAPYEKRTRFYKCLEISYWIQ